MTTSVLAPESTTKPDVPRAEAPEPLRAVHSQGFPELLRELGISLLVTTYQAGKLVIVRDPERESEHPLPHLPAAHGPGLEPQRCPRTCPTLPPGRAEGHARRLFSAPVQSCHRRCADPRDGLWPWRRALVRQHALLLPGNHQPDVELFPPLAAAVRLQAGTVGPLSPKRHGPAGRRASLRDRFGRDRRAGR